MSENKKIKIITLGCSKNLVDSEALMGQIEANGLSIASENDDDAKVIIINTCGFINDAKEESIDTILQFAQAKNKKKVDKVYVMGCLSERYKDDLRKEIPNIDQFYGVNQMSEIINELGINYRTELIGERKITTPSHYAYLKISEGCDRTCSFCAIPGIRGKHKSKSIEDLVIESQKLADKGVKELILIAQDLTYYGFDIYKKQSLSSLLKELVKIESIKWVRLHYAYPAQFPDDVLDLMASESKICNYIDIPLQHNNDRILKSMRRGHNSNTNKQLLEKFRQKVPNLTVRSTFIVGYPGETEEEFNDLKNFIIESQLDRVGVFTYSHEENTHAFNLADDVPDEIKQARADELMQIQEEISLEKNLAKIGKQFMVLIDRKEGDFWIGRTESDSPEVDNEVIITSSDNLAIGNFYNIMIERAENFDLFGKTI